MLAENLIVLAIDGVQSGYLGPYGNTWVPTPGWNELAARSLLLEWHLADATDLAEIYRGFWSGLPAGGSPGDRKLSRLIERMDAVSVTTTCLSDEPQVADWAAREAKFSVVEKTEPARPGRSYENWEESDAGRWAMMAAETAVAQTSRFFLWVHCGAMARAWQAPYAWRERFRDDEDPEPASFTEPPQGSLSKEVDPDELLDYAHAYAAEIMLTDAYLSAFCEALEHAPFADRTALLVLSPRGYSLGDHRRLGIAEETWYSEAIQTPALLALPDGTSKLVRRTGLYQTCDLYATCLEILGIECDSRWSRSWLSPEPPPDRAAVVHAEGGALRTPAWLALWHGDRPFELYVKPDDRWEANDVSQRRSEIEPLAAEVLADYRRAVEEGDRKRLQPLPEALLTVGE